MLYEALVIDNKDFKEKGTIRVRIKDKTPSPKMTTDLSIDPTKSIDVYGGQSWNVSSQEREFVYRDTDVKVSSPIGGGYDYGLFHLPQPNTWGIVALLGDPWETSSKGNYVWLGSLYKRDPASKTIDIPSKYIDNQSSGVEGNGEDVVENIDFLNSSIILKTKSTEISGGAKEIDQNKSQKTLNFKRVPTENLFIIDKEKIQISHNITFDEESRDDQTKALATIQIDKNGFNINYYDKENSRTSEIKLDNDGNFKIIKSGEKINSSIIGDDNGITADYSEGDNKSASLKIGSKPNGINANYKSIASLSAYEKGKPTCSISIKSNGIDIESGGDVNISPGNGGKVSVGGVGMPVLLSPTGGDIVVGNVTIPCSKNLIG